MQKKLMKNLMLVFVMAVLCFAVCMTANAYGETMAETGQCGDNVYWNYDSVAKELVISGTGPMWDYEPGESPFIAFEHNKIPAKIFFEKVIINEGVTTVGNYAFDNEGEVYVTGESKGITSVSLPETVTKIGEGAFSECCALKKINLPSGIKKIEKETFKACAFLENVAIPHGVIEIDDYAFENCVFGLDSLVIPDSVIRIGKGAFFRNQNVKSLSLSKNIKEIDDEAFSYCASIESITIPDSVEHIGVGAFSYCLNLKELTLSENTKDIGEFAFSFCFSLEDVFVPAGITNLPAAAFGACIMLKDVTLPKSIISIDEAAFAGCLSLKNMSIPENTTYIGSETFSDCWSLEQVIVYSEDVVYGEEIFKDYFTLLNGATIEDAIGAIKQYIYYSEIDNLLVRPDGSFGLTEEVLQKLINTLVELDEAKESDSIALHGHTHSTTENYAIERNIPFIRLDETYHPDTYFADDWTYDYDNMIRYRNCTYINCDVVETEPLETTTDSDVEIIEPNDPDTDFVVDEIEKNSDNYLLIEETIINNVSGYCEILKAFDITLKNSDGVHVQPDGTVKVKLPLDWSKDGIYKVYRVNDDGTLTDMNAYRQGSHMVFDTDHFSIYVIVDESVQEEAPEEVPEETPEETKGNFFSKIIDFIVAFFELIFSWFKK